MKRYQATAYVDSKYKYYNTNVIANNLEDAKLQVYKKLNWMRTNPLKIISIDLKELS